MSRFNHIIFLLCFVLARMISVAQTDGPDTFYKHFTGMLDTNMFISIDLQASAGKISGQYNYYFKIQGSNNEYYYGKTIPVQGEIQDELFVFHDYTSGDSKFTCRFNDKGALSGTWRGGRPVKEIPFSFIEDYSNGSLQLTSYNIDRTHYLLEGEDFESISPKAKISIRMLYPGNSASKQLKDTLDAAITLFMINESKPVKTPRLLMENIVYDFFDSYIKSTEGIDDITDIASFNWEKQITIDVLCNQYNILSLKFSKYAFTGGAHGISMSDHKVFDLEHNRTLSLSDFIKPGSLPALSNILDKKIRNLNGLQKGEKLEQAGFLIENIQPNNNFFINTYGIGFFYNVYEIAPYASGTTELFIPFNEVKDLLKSDAPFRWLK